MSDTKKLTAAILATSLDIDELLAKRFLKLIAIKLALDLSGGNSVEIDYLGTFNKKGRFWSFTESTYLNDVRSKEITLESFYNLIINEDDN